MSSSATLPRNREAMRIRREARRAAKQAKVDPAFVRIAAALQPEESAPAPRGAIFTALGAVLGFAVAWLVLQYREGWYVFAALGLSLGACVGSLVARLFPASQPEPSDWDDWLDDEPPLG